MTAEAPQFTPLSVQELQPFFPEFTIISFIAAGGMGAVYQAEEKPSGNPVAIKILPREMTSDPGYNQQFKDEAAIMAKMKHPNLVDFYEIGEVDGMLYILMELVEGKSLHHSAHGEKIEPETAIRVALGVAEGVKSIHDSGMIHRDIKPANILLDQTAFPKLCDFGLAHETGESEEGKVIFGTPGYTAPEVLNNPHAIDERSDIYSIGAIFYELLTGCLPDSLYIPPSQKFKQLNPIFDPVLKKALARDPDLRYPHMKAFITDLSKIQQASEAGESLLREAAPALITGKVSVKSTDLDPLDGMEEHFIEAAPVYEKPPQVVTKNFFATQNGILLMCSLAAVLVIGGIVIFTGGGAEETPEVEPVVTDIESFVEPVEVAPSIDIEVFEKAVMLRASKAIAHKRESSEEDNIKLLVEAKWAMAQWLKTLEGEEKEKATEAVNTYFKIVQAEGVLQSVVFAKGITGTAKQTLQSYVDRQKQLSQSYNDQLLAVKDDAIQQVREKAKEVKEAEPDLARKLRSIVASYREMDALEFDEYVMLGQ